MKGVLGCLQNIPPSERPKRARELCEVPDAETNSLFRDAGLIALGICAAGRKRVMIYQLPDGRLGTTDL